MKIDIKPSFFYGAAIATILGLGLGGMLHGSWDSVKAGGPSILFPSAQAAERAPATDPTLAADGDAVSSDAAQPDADPMATWGGTVAANPQPVIRLAAAQYDAMAAAKSEERQDVDAAAPDAEPLASTAEPPPPADAPPAPPLARPAEPQSQPLFILPPRAEDSATH